MIGKLLQLAQLARRKLHRREIKQTIVVANRRDLSTPLRTGSLYIVGEPQQWAMFRCPCGNGHDIALRIDHDGQWSLPQIGPRPTIYPSVNSFANGRRCHYWVRRGRVDWCVDSGPIAADARIRPTTAG